MRPLQHCRPEATAFRNSHPNDEFILRGIAKSHMIRVCYRLNIPVLEKPFTMDFLKSADEIL